MIKSFCHKGLQRFFETENTSGIQSGHASRLKRQLAALDQAKQPADITNSAWRLHALRGKCDYH
ncbi:hypothetical protein GTP58_10420 [Duganella sp. CY15W]|uniref:type II toxin-antitoxin system RelE/ParE family toxin n=1 Tax=Duganella sp. CY15W TaxID=2692172 RepID=UPI00136D8BFA|nr:type II toxin-antitoxin system RelE/ParE family toxin [Duganella sp. CY15W]MYM28737.1 hypothetical protein [Duganella sp. CY15W]